jgi:predicted regulator of Ras-like GTPase activity (Roadblock/LC7/MglB family)
MSKVEEIQKGISQLRLSVPELRGVLLATTEGLPVAHALSDGLDPQRFAAMAAAAVSLAKKFGENLNSGPMAEISVTGSEAQIFIYAAGPKAVLALAAPAAGNAGLIHLEARSVAHSFAQMF